MRKAHIGLVTAVIAVAAVAAMSGIDRAFAPERPARIVFVGDMMFDRTIRSIAEREGYGHILSCARDYLRGFDLAVGNLEGPITAEASASAGTKPGDPGNTRFTFDPAVAAALRDAGFGAASLGNNHILDFGRPGADGTVAALDEAGLLSFGAPGHGDVATTTIGGTTVALVSFNQFLGEAKPERAEASIRAARAGADLVAVYAHWGDEYVGENDYQRALARRFVDAGADIVVGSHPHVVQGREEYKGKPIYYSLGNFIFDQYWNEGVRTGLAVEVSVGPRHGGAGGPALSVAERAIDISRDGRSCPR